MPFVFLQLIISHFDIPIEEDWAKFDINNRTTHDASISSGLAIMACNKNKYRPVPKIIRQNYDLGIKKYDNSGLLSKIID